MIARRPVGAKHLLAAAAMLAGGFAVGFFALPYPGLAPRMRPTAAAPLMERIPQVQLRDTTVGAAFDDLRRLTNANLVMDWRTLAEIGITSDTPLHIDLRLHDVSLAQALSKYLSTIVVPDNRLEFEERDGVVFISLNNARRTSTQIYDVRDLLGTGGNWERLAVRPEVTDPATQPFTIEERGERLTHLLTVLVAPQSWRDNGGQSGAARVMMGRLIVTQTPENHDRIAEVLQILRDADSEKATHKGQ